MFIHSANAKCCILVSSTADGRRNMKRGRGYYAVLCSSKDSLSSTLLSPSRFQLILLLSAHLLSPFHPPLLHSPIKRLNRSPPKILGLLLATWISRMTSPDSLGVRWITAYKQIIMNT